ncbi:uncharacterized protein I303_103239 [Kwoniella dejecticola CBS 10117]|uniref:Uncharacterized protein n=1 Tax=Kwoniella dejecticola CBS 10117 TaxID=1296121 RepID=A0A1A6AB01_9TREE|nr:uncharacterized protein I303_03262 [Kwoniella dejecticola CBS 10117]OBR87237.1 hypothetical protein I303_03262 [Kwoniella dejecticola CBS 10117]
MTIQYLSPDEVTKRSKKLFSPNFKSPRRVVEPRPPSLAWSKLPPPAAEIDERLDFRVRRFKLWKEVNLELRRIVADPKKRNHLRRYQSYAIPPTLLNAHRRPQNLPNVRPSRPGTPTRISTDEWSWTTPLRIRTPAKILPPAVDQPDPSTQCTSDIRLVDSLIGQGGLLTPPLSPQTNPADETQLDSEHRQSKGEANVPYPVEAGLVPSIPGHISDSTEQAPKSFTNTPQSKPIDDEKNETQMSLCLSRNARNKLSTSSTTPATPTARSQAYWIPPTPPLEELPWYAKSLTKRQRKVNFQKLLEFKWILDQEHERRFRIGMSKLMESILIWQNQNTKPFDQWKTGDKFKWRDDVDLVQLENITAFYRAIRKKSSNIFDYFDPEEMDNVPFRTRVHEQVKDEDARKRRKKEKKEAKKRAEAEAEAAAINGHGGRTAENDLGSCNGNSLHVQAVAETSKREDDDQTRTRPGPEVNGTSKDKSKSPLAKPNSESLSDTKTPRIDQAGPAAERKNDKTDKHHRKSSSKSKSKAESEGKASIHDITKRQKESSHRHRSILRGDVLPLDQYVKNLEVEARGGDSAAEDNRAQLQSHPQDDDKTSELSALLARLEILRTQKVCLATRLAKTKAERDNATAHDQAGEKVISLSDRSTAVIELADYSSSEPPHKVGPDYDYSFGESSRHNRSITSQEEGVRYGSFNLDDDTALPDSSRSPSSHSPDFGLYLPSSAFSRGQVSVEDLSEGSHSSSFDEQSVGHYADDNDNDDDVGVGVDRDTIAPISRSWEDEGEVGEEREEQKDTEFSGMGTWSNHTVVSQP